MNKNFRVHTNIASDTVLNVNMQQDFDFLEVLSLKLRQKDAYRLHSSNYGVIIGRVLANDAFGIPNAKVSVFIERDTNDSSDIESIYPYTEITTKDKLGRRYNLLPDESDDDCYRVVGTFPNKRLVLDNDIYLDVFDKYWKYTTVTNQAGDYMIFGVPTSSVQVHVDIDLSDIGILSQKPRDFEYKGYNITMFDTPNQFKESTNLDSLAQIFSQNKSVFVYPFWGDSDNGVAAITRSDIQIQYKFEPTCVFMGSIVSDNDGHSIGHKCAPDVDNGMNDQLIGGNGTIEMIRKTTDGLVEEYQIQGNQLIDENGVWCYQIPMNLDYIGTDEYGNIVPTDNPTKGIPTRTQVRFRFSKNETNEEGFSRHTAKYLVPMNPIFSEEKVIPTIDIKGSEVEKMYLFGSATPESCFRDLYWNNVYSVKNYIPKTQVAHRAYAKNYSSLKGANLAEDQNAVPFNKLRVDIPFTFMILCILFKIVMIIIAFINTLVCLIDSIINIFYRIKKFSFKVFKWRVRPFGWLPVPDFIGCIPLSAGLSEGNVAYYPGCWCKSTGLKHADCPDDMEGDCKKVNDNSTLTDIIQRNLALDFKIVKLDFYQDWLNGCLYMPLWYWRKRKKKTFLFGLFSSRAKNEYCSCGKTYSRLKTYVTCNIGYEDNNLTATNSSMPDSENRWHKNKTGQVRYKRGLIKAVENKDGLTAYYYVATQAVDDSTNKNPDLEMEMVNPNFHAVRLYATDIILLGNLDPNNIYGIPQFFTCLPSTTANIPAIATIEETINPEEEEKESSKDIGGDSEDSGTTITTGMDWGHNGNKQTPKYKTGLFMDLSCTYAATRPKSCINVERLSEYGVNLDMTYNMAYHSGGNDVKYGQFDSDGFINKLELDDTENRAMFATLNHIGFIPQSYQDSLTNGCTTQIPDENTSYLIPKFKYIYPVDFDGRLKVPMDLYRNSFQQALYDEADQAYLTFRLGAESGRSMTDNSELRIRHFYHDNGNYDMPLYNNSFYFYFGIKKGSTAIDKFNQMFYAVCYKQDKKPFTLDIDKRGRSYCPSIYKDTNGYGYIKVTLDDIRAPYTYKLYDSFGDIIIEETGMTYSQFVIGGTINASGDIISNPEVRYQIPVEENEREDGKNYYHDETTNLYYEIVDSFYGNNTSGLTNQEYILEVIDNNGKMLSEKIKLDVPKIVGEYESVRLGTKFYDINTTRIDYICHDDNKFYGIIKLKDIIVDGHKCEIARLSGGLPIENINYANGKYTLDVYCISEDFNTEVKVSLTLNVYKQDSGETTTNKCMCDNANEVPNNENMFISGTTKPYWIAYKESEKVIEFYVYQPNRFLLTLTEYCNGSLVVENTSSEIVNIQNGENFTATLNNMPVKFMLGTLNDSSAATIANTSKLYKSTPFDAANDVNSYGWYGLHQESSYKFDTTIEKNQEIWEDAISTITDSVTTPEIRRNILKFKFNSMFNLCEGAYVTKDSSLTFTYRANGGVSPLLYRSAAPMYDDSTKIKNKYLLTDSWQTDGNEYAPNIITSNYKKRISDGEYDFQASAGPRYNNVVYEADTSHLLGNYFAAFTHNGSYISNTQIDGININITRVPSFASVSPMNGVKRLGQDKEGKITDFSWVYSAQTQQLENDKLRRTLPYVRALYVDRRFDYDLIVLAPSVNNNSISLHIDKGKDRIWRGGRLSGTTYNGIEMAYDENYNIISGDPHFDEALGKYTYANSNNRLEYSYKYDSDTGSNATTIYNYETNPIKTVWNSENSVKYLGNSFGYNAEIDVTSSTITKQFYTSELYDFDIRHLYWSDFNQNRITTYCTNGGGGQQISGSGENAIKNLNNPFYVYKYPSEISSLYNRDFNRENAYRTPNSTGYPSRRYLDIGNLPQTPTFSYLTQCCSYGIKASNEDDGTIIAEANGGESTEISIEFGKAITFIPPNADTKKYANVSYNMGTLNGGFIHFSASTASVNFKFESFSNDYFDVYTKVPKLIKVLPYIKPSNDNGIDGIGYIKTVNPRTEFGKWGDGKSLDAAIEDVELLTFDHPTWTIFSILDSDLDQTVVLPEGVKIVDNYENKEKGFYGADKLLGKFFKEDDELGEYILSDDDVFTNIVFQKENLNIRETKAFTILVDREYVYQDSDNLKRHIRSIETTDIYDCRDLFLGTLIAFPENGELASYVTATSAATEVYPPEVITGVTPDSEDIPTGDPSDPSSTEVVTGITSSSGETSGNTKICTQVITFQFKFDTNSGTSIQDRQCEAFADYKMMSYTFKFKIKYDYYELVPFDITQYIQGNDTYIRYSIRWTEDMGIFADYGGSIDCEIYAKTKSNFSYRITNFKINYVSQDHLPKDTMATDGTKYKTEISISL